MPVPPTPASALGSLLWLLAVGGSSFLVSWLLGNVEVVRRSLYIAVLAVVAAGLWTGYALWLGVGWTAVTHHWAWGLIGAPIFAAYPALGIRRLPSSQRRTGRDLVAALAWEGVVYGAAEGLLLSALPAYITWQMVHSLGWGGLAQATLAVLASAAVIVVHHLGYWEYRNRLLVSITAGCGLLTVGYLITASVFTPVVGHMLMHLSAIQHGTELPPHHRPAAGTAPRPVYAGTSA